MLTCTVVLGIALSRRWHTAGWPRLVVHETHRWATLTFYLFVTIHVAFLLLDPFFGLTVADVAVPFLHDFRPLWFGLGIIAAELAFALGASVLFRDRIGYRTWHALHGLAYPIFAASLLHGIGTGSDTGAWWTTLLYGGTTAAVAAATVWRVVRPVQPRVTLMTASVVVVGVVFIGVL